MGLQSCKSPNLGDFGTPTWESRDKKSHLDVGPVERCRVYYKGEGGGFPQVRTVVSLMCPCCPWLVLAPKVLQLRTNHLVWVLCRPVWVSEACQLFLVPSRSSNMPLYPSKCCELGSVPRLSFFCYFLLGLTFESFKELGVRHLCLHYFYNYLLHKLWCACLCYKILGSFCKWSHLLHQYVPQFEFKWKSLCIS